MKSGKCIKVDIMNGFINHYPYALFIMSDHAAVPGSRIIQLAYCSGCSLDTFIQHGYIVRLIEVKVRIFNRLVIAPGERRTAQSRY